MPNQAVPIAKAYTARSRRLSVDDAVKAVLSFRSAEQRSFGNEDDVEGSRPLPAQMQAQTPKP
jgi:hypothetical protein